jgi:hypothetical protein
MMLVSAIIPTFNSREYVRCAIESVLGQTYPNIEIVIVDDGSTDETVEMVKNFLKRSDKNWQVLSLGKNRGPSVARNAGYLAARGTWLQFLDSDDMLMPNKIECEVAVAAKVANDVAVVHSPWNMGFFRESGQIEWLGPTKRSCMRNQHPIMCLVEGRPLLGSSLVRRCALNEVGGFDESLRFWECEEINVRLARVGTFEPVQSNTPQYVWRMRSDEVYIGGPGSRYNLKDVAIGWITQAVNAADSRHLQDLRLSDDDRRLVLNECTLWGRHLYSQDRTIFRDYLRLARTLDPQVAPSYPRYISMLSRWVGYEAAEGAARVARRPRGWLRSVLYWLGLRSPNMVLELK